MMGDDQHYYRVAYPTLKAPKKYVVGKIKRQGEQLSESIKSSKQGDERYVTLITELVFKDTVGNTGHNRTYETAHILQSNHSGICTNVHSAISRVH